MLARFSAAASTVLKDAVNEAESLHHDHLDTAHVVLALLRQSRGRAAAVLDALAVKRDAAITAILESVPAGQAPSVAERPYSANAMKMLQSAMSAAAEDDAEVDTDHLLIGVAANPDGTGMRVLARFARPSTIIAEARRQRNPDRT